MAKMTKVDEDLCAGCAACVEVCPEEAIEMDGPQAVVDQEKCNHCESCIEECPTEAIVIVEV